MGGQHLEQSEVKKLDQLRAFTPLAHDVRLRVWYAYGQGYVVQLDETTRDDGAKMKRNGPRAGCRPGSCIHVRSSGSARSFINGRL